MGAAFRLLFWKRNRLGAGAGRLSVSPFLPIRFGVAALPTHRPISNGQAPS